jgi:hypothetical protein
MWTSFSVCWVIRGRLVIFTKASSSVVSERVKIAVRTPSEGGLNRVHRKFAQILMRLNIARFTSPVAGKALLREADVSRELQQGKDQIMHRDIQQDFRAEVTVFKAAVRGNLDEAHCLLNGKWLVSDLAVRKTRKSADDCRAAWIAHAAFVGGLREVKDWWTRAIGKAP